MAPVAVANRRGAVRDGAFSAVAAYQYRVVRQTGDTPATHHQLCGVGNRLPGLLVDDVEDLGEWPAGCRAVGPPGERLRVRIQVRRAAIRVRGDDTVTDAVERDAKPFLLRGKLTREPLLLCDVADDLRDGDNRADGSRTGDADSEISRRRPSFAIRTVSKCWSRSPLRSLVRISSSSNCRSGRYQ